jgi:GNAT superfamily N-acetyltransferase
VNRTVVPEVASTVAEEVPRLARLLSVAFADNPVSDWLFQGEQDAFHPGFFTAYLNLALDAGHIDQALDGSAVAVWINHTTTPKLERFRKESADVMGAHLPRLVLLEATLYQAAPQQPHWWLAFLGVLPAAQGRGQGGRLLRHARTWQGDTMTYLEATSRRLVGYYRRHGFADGPALPIPQGPTVHPMWVRPDPGRVKAT